MRAVVCHAFGPLEGLRIEDLPTPRPGQGQVLVEVHAAGVNFTDLLAVEGRSQLARRFPMTPGVEAAGVVREVGSGVTKVRPGDRVLGSRIQGAYAEAVLFDEDELAVIPDEMDMMSAATFCIATMTVRYALADRARLRPGETLLVLGAGGGAGLAGIEIGKATGARVVAAASSDDKLDLARASGADAVVRYPRGPLDLAAQKALTAELLAQAAPAAAPAIGGAINSVEDSGYDVILDGVGGSYAEPALRALAWQGRYLSLGFAAGMAKVALGPLLFKNADIMGIQPVTDEVRLPGRNLAAMQDMFDLFRQGRLRPRISASFDLAEAGKALALLRDRQATGRIVLITGK